MTRSSSIRWRLIAPVAFVFGGFGLTPVACSHDNASCWDGTCVCAHDAHCVFGCSAPPCHVECQVGAQCTAACANGDCTCDTGSDCQFSCVSGPCHVACADDSKCAGTCADGTCECGSGSTCDFDCLAGPCHVTCAGNNPHCKGVCANGACDCGTDSSCQFSCSDGDCTATCGAGSTCVLDCPVGHAGAQGCRFESCAAGAPVVCPDGTTTTCGAPCP